MFAFLTLIMAFIMMACGGEKGAGGGVTGSKSAVVGTYVRQDKQSDYLELRKDGTYNLVNVLVHPAFFGVPERQQALEKTGEWSIEDDGRVVCLEGTLLCLRIRPNILVDRELGTVWVKQNGSSRPSETTVDGRSESSARAPKGLLLQQIQYVNDGKWNELLQTCNPSFRRAYLRNYTLQDFRGDYLRNLGLPEDSLPKGKKLGIKDISVKIKDDVAYVSYTPTTDGENLDRVTDHEYRKIEDKWYDDKC